VPEPLALRCPPDDINTVHDYVQRVWDSAPDLDSMDKLKFETAIVELAANVIQHADDGDGVRGTVVVTVDGDRIRGSVTDTACASTVALEPREMPDQSAESGRGIAFIQRLVDVLHYERRDGENLWMIEKIRQSPGS